MGSMKTEVLFHHFQYSLDKVILVANNGKMINNTGAVLIIYMGMSTSFTDAWREKVVLKIPMDKS